MPIVRQSLIILLIAAVASLAANHFRSDSLPLVGDWSPQTRFKAPDSGESLVISLDEAETLFFAQEAVFVDARSAELFAEGHIEGARSVPLSELDERLSEVTADVPPDFHVIAYCDGESCNSSKEVALALIDRGYTQVRVLVNGWSAWREAGLPIQE